MTVSTTAFGVYFYLMSKVHSPNPRSLLMLDVQATAEPHTDLSWLALASVAVFISGDLTLEDISKILKLVYQPRERFPIFLKN